MTRQEAVEVLKDRAFMKCDMYLCDMDCQDCLDALNMAIEALEEKYPCGLCKYYEDKENWGLCQYCPAEPKGSDGE